MIKHSNMQYRNLQREHNKIVRFTLDFLHVSVGIFCTLSHDIIDEI
jgi:hypothetical protein